MNIDKSRIGTSEFRAYEMRKLVRFLGNKVRSQKFTNQFIAYNADMSENEMLECMKLKPIKHETYVKFFNSIVSIIANHREMNKENIEYELIEDMKRDPLIEPNRISQIVGWNDYSKVNKSTPILPKPISVAKNIIKNNDSKSKNNIIYDIAELAGVDNPTDKQIELIERYLSSKYGRRIKKPVVSYLVASAMREIIVENGLLIKDFFKMFGERPHLIYKFFYPQSLLTHLSSPDKLNKITKKYVEIMKTKGYSAEESTELLNKQLEENRQRYIDAAKYRVFNILFNNDKNKLQISDNDISNSKNSKIMDMFKDVKPISKEDLFNTLIESSKPYIQVKEGFIKNDKASLGNAYCALTSISALYEKLGLDDRKDFIMGKLIYNSDTNMEKYKVSLYNARDFSAKSKYSIKDALNLLAFTMTEVLDVDMEVCYSVIRNEIMEESRKVHDAIKEKLSGVNVDKFDSIVNRLYEIEEPSDLEMHKKAKILFQIIKDYTSSVYGISTFRLYQICKAHGVGKVEKYGFNPIHRIVTKIDTSYDRYTDLMFKALSELLCEYVDFRNVDVEVILNEMKSFIVYQVTHYSKHYGINIDIVNKVKTTANMEVLNFNTVEETEDYVESLFDSNKPEETVKAVEEDNTDIKEEENDENMGRKRVIDMFDDEERDHMRDREDDERIDDVVCRRRLGRRSNVGLGDLYKALRTIEEYFESRRVTDDEKEDIVRLVKSFMR